MWNCLTTDSETLQIFDFIRRKFAVQPLEQRILTAFSLRSLICMCIHTCNTACLYKLHIPESPLFFFFAIGSVYVYVNLRSMFPSLNVVMAGPNRMQVRCSFSLCKRYTEWPEGHWTDITEFMLFVFLCNYFSNRILFHGYTQSLFSLFDLFYETKEWRFASFFAKLDYSSICQVLKRYSNQVCFWYPSHCEQKFAARRRFGLEMALLHHKICRKGAHPRYVLNLLHAISSVNRHQHRRQRGKKTSWPVGILVVSPSL